MIKRLCDICKGDLFIIKKIPNSIDSFVNWYKCRNPFRIKGYFRILGPFPTHNHSPDELEICSECFTDFKEFIKSKNSSLSVEK